MRPAVDTFWETLRDWYNGMVGLAALNLLWVGLSLTVVLCPPATAGIYTVTHSITWGTGQHLGDFVTGARRYAWLSYQWALANLVAGGVIAVNFAWWGAVGGVPGAAVQVLTLTVAVVWLATQFYVWPFLVEQEDKRLLLALKNALFLSLATPVHTLILLGIVGLVAVASLVTILPLAVFTLTFVALLGTRAVRERLIAFGKVPDPNAPVPERDPGEPAER
jgi:hypothetical protein